jgi:putative ABC transport system substrate-binding protein
VTGLSAVFVDLAAKHLELLNDSIAKLSTVALLANATTTQLYRGAYISELQQAADALHVSLHVVQVSSPDELEQAISSAANAHSNAVLIQPDGLFFQQRKRIAELAMTKGLATIGWTVEIADAGALMSYGADAPDLFRRAATYVDKILKGANPSDLPIEQPTKHQFENREIHKYDYSTHCTFQGGQGDRIRLGRRTGSRIQTPRPRQG